MIEGALADAEIKKMTSGEMEKVVTALSLLETELIALKDVMDIIDQIPMEHPRPVYLIRRVSEHVRNLDGHFRSAWATIHRIDRSINK